MSAYQFRLDSTLFNGSLFNSHRFRNAFVLRKPRHPLLRIALGLLGLGVLLTLVFFSVFVGIAMLAVGVLARMWKLRGKPVARDMGIVEGEFRVIGKPVPPRA
ncbi:MAG TPA: hypothetical protein VHF02_07310 [Luteimonas sp.]|nr:hypothetical protein [Luteimonas sp.]